MPEIAIRDLATQLAHDAGKSVPLGVEPLVGGRNNRVYRVEFSNEAPAVLKWYHSDHADRRDRLKAEWRFLNYVMPSVAVNVPKPLAVRSDLQAALYTWMPGERPDNITRELSRQAAAFVVAINNDLRTDTVPLEPASEACFSLQQHLATVQHRVDRLTELDATLPEFEEVRSFVRSKLVPVWRSMKDEIESSAAERGVPIDGPIRKKIVSPSDFGFHNALVDAQGRAAFIDFEYAGTDDPAKLISDYFCQPERPVPLEFYDEFVGDLAAGLGLSNDDLWRARVLAPAYRIKWVCIMLNEFSRVGARRRSFASSSEHAARAKHQLRRAETYFAPLLSKTPGERCGL